MYFTIYSFYLVLEFSKKSSHCRLKMALDFFILEQKKLRVDSRWTGIADVKSTTDRIKLLSPISNASLQGKSKQGPGVHREGFCKVPLRRTSGWIVLPLHYISPSYWTQFPHILLSFLILLWFCLPDIMVTDGMNQPYCLDWISLILANIHKQFYGAGWGAFLFL